MRKWEHMRKGEIIVLIAACSGREESLTKGREREIMRVLGGVRGAMRRDELVY